MWVYVCVCVCVYIGKHGWVFILEMTMEEHGLKYHPKMSTFVITTFFIAVRHSRFLVHTSQTVDDSEEL